MKIGLEIMSDIVLNRSMNLGTGMAENDNDFLTKCFLETPEYKTLIDFDDKKTILLGRTGSGKTALIKMLLANPKFVPIEIRPDTFALQYLTNIPIIREMKETGLNLSVFYKFLWLHEIISNIVKQYFRYNKNKDFFESILERFGNGGRVKDLKKYLEKNDGIFFKPETVERITEGLESNVGEKLGFSAFAGIKSNLKESQKQEVQSKINQHINSEQIAQLKNIITIFKDYFGMNMEQKIIVTIDNLDENWTDENTKYHLIAALLDAVKMFIDIPNIKIVIAMRSDLLNKTIMEMHRQAEKDTAFTLKINWTKDMLEELVNKKLQYLFEYKYQKKTSVTFKQLFNCDISGIRGYKYILEKVFLRPRDIINFVNFCLINADGKYAVLSEHILAAEDKYRTYLLSALKHEWLYLYPNIDLYIKAIRDSLNNSFIFDNALHKYDEIQSCLLSISNYDNDQLIKDFLSCNNEYCKKDNIKKLINTAFIIGFLGKSGNTDSIIYSNADVPELDMLDYDDYSFHIHPIFAKRANLN